MIDRSWLQLLGTHAGYPAVFPLCSNNTARFVSRIQRCFQWAYILFQRPINWIRSFSSSVSFESWSSTHEPKMYNFLTWKKWCQLFHVVLTSVFFPYVDVVTLYLGSYYIKIILFNSLEYVTKSYFKMLILIINTYINITSSLGEVERFSELKSM